MLAGRCSATASPSVPASATRLDLRDALRPVPARHHAAIVDPVGAGKLLRDVMAYEGHPVTRAALKLSALLLLRPEEPDENVCWPLTGSGEIDIFEHHSDGGPNHYALRAIKSTGVCGGGDWQALMHVQAAPLGDYHEYSVEWDAADLVFRLDGKEIHRSVKQGDQFPEPLFAILNFAKINASPMTVPAWTMEVDWVKHERALPSRVTR